MKTRKTWIVIVIVIIVATIVFIWGNSLKSRSESQGLSLGVLQLLRPLLNAIFSPGNVTDHLVRKMAHFAEFGALGAEFVLLTILLRKLKWQSILNCLFAGLLVALTDETIQLFSSRGSQVVDVDLDFSGVVTGVLLMLLIYQIVKAIRRAKHKGGVSA